MIKGKEENIRESVIGPQGAGPCARESSKWIGPIGHATLRSHEIPDVMPATPK